MNTGAVMCLCSPPALWVFCSRGLPTTAPPFGLLKFVMQPRWSYLRSGLHDARHADSL
jgi:hypothetical protein